MSIYLPDDLAARAKEFDPEANMSQLIQVSLRRLLGASDTAAPGYAQRPADADEGLQRARDALAPAAQAEYQAGYASALHRLADVPWQALDEFAERGFDLRRWIEPWSNGIMLEAARGIDGEPKWFWKLAEDLGNLVDPIGFVSKTP